VARLDWPFDIFARQNPYVSRFHTPPLGWYHSLSKKTIATLLIFAASFAYADKQHNVGIGLGTQVFEGHDGLVSQVCAATTNGSFGNQTFAISSGTLGANKPAELWASKELNKFVEENMDGLVQDMAQGQGESLDAICSILQIENKDAFNATLQQNFGTIYTSGAISHDEVIGKMKSLAR
jgi:hypothetical protein